MGVHHTRRAPAILFAVAVAAFALIVAACAGTVPEPSTTPEITPSPAPNGVLLSVETRGGLCAGGPCGTTIYVGFDGRVHLAAKPPNELGFVEPAALAALTEAIRTTDFAELKRRPFTGTCPAAFDGQEIVYEFATPHGTERIATCEVAVDFGAPLFVAVSTAVGPFIALPTT